MINILLPRLPFITQSIVTRLYFDSCCLSRAFDDKSHPIVAKECNAIWEIMNMIQYKYVDLAWSYVLTIEGKRIRDAQKRFEVLDWQNYAVVDVPKSQEIYKIANEIQKTGVHKFDAQHIACAIKANCQYFVTTDYRLQKYHDKRIYVCDPIECLEILHNVL
jgi:predicted nucleic acid-binding protein